MILGLSLSAFTALHTITSLVAMVAGVVVFLGMLSVKRLDAWVALYLATAILTDVTGYFFPVSQILPSHIVGAISLVTLAVAVLAFYRYRLAGAWRWLYIVSVALSLYLDVFVGVIQAFGNLAFLRPLAPTQTEPPFVVAQCLVLVVFIALGWLALKWFHPDGTAQRQLATARS